MHKAVRFTLLLLSAFSSLAASEPYHIKFYGEYGKPLLNCRFFLFEYSDEGDFLKAHYRYEILEEGVITLEELPKNYEFGVTSENKFRMWWSDGSSPGTSLKLSKKETWIYVPKVGHVELKILNPDLEKGELRCAIEGEGVGKSFPITFDKNNVFTIEDRRAGSHRITITSEDGKRVYFKSEEFSVQADKVQKLAPITLVSVPSTE